MRPADNPKAAAPPLRALGWQRTPPGAPPRAAQPAPPPPRRAVSAARPERSNCAFSFRELSPPGLEASPLLRAHPPPPLPPARAPAGPRPPFASPLPPIRPARGARPPARCAAALTRLITRLIAPPACENPCQHDFRTAPRRAAPRPRLVADAPPPSCMKRLLWLRRWLWAWYHRLSVSALPLAPWCYNVTARSHAVYASTRSRRSDPGLRSENYVVSVAGVGRVVAARWGPKM